MSIYYHVTFRSYYLLWVKNTTHQKAKSWKASSLQNGTCSLNLLNPTCSYSHPNNLHQTFLPTLKQIFSVLFHLPTCSQNHPYNIHQTQGVYTSPIFGIPILYTAIPTISTKTLFPNSNSFPSQLSLHQGFNKQRSLVKTDTVLISPNFPKE